MNCDNYLSMLETLPIEQLAYGDAREHAATCRDCDRVTRVVVERERSMRMAFGDVYSSAPPDQIAARALVMSRRRTVAVYYRFGLGVATVATVLFMVASRKVGPSPAAIVKERFQLQCLSPEQAAEVLRQRHDPSTGFSIRPDSPLGIINVEAPPAAMEQVRALLARYDTPAESQCAVQGAVPKVVKVP
jgi:hypothetical protein